MTDFNNHMNCAKTQWTTRQYSQYSRYSTYSNPEKDKHEETVETTEMATTSKDANAFDTKKDEQVHEIDAARNAKTPNTGKPCVWPCTLCSKKFPNEEYLMKHHSAWHMAHGQHKRSIPMCSLYQTIP